MEGVERGIVFGAGGTVLGEGTAVVGATYTADLSPPSHFIMEK